jgi:hypothetical protein
VEVDGITIDFVDCHISRTYIARNIFYTFYKRHACALFIADDGSSRILRYPVRFRLKSSV